jgi:hypothetical protein
MPKRPESPKARASRVARFNEHALARREWSFAMAEKNLKELYHDTLKDIYFAEKEDSFSSAKDG